MPIDAIWQAILGIHLSSHLSCLSSHLSIRPCVYPIYLYHLIYHVYQLPLPSVHVCIYLTFLIHLSTVYHSSIDHSSLKSSITFINHLSSIIHINHLSIIYLSIYLSTRHHLPLYYGSSVGSSLPRMLQDP